MQINNYSYNYIKCAPKFKSRDEEWNTFGIDSATEDVRKELRKHYEEHIMPYSSIYLKDEPSTIEYMFIHYPRTVNIGQPIKLENTKNSYRGSSLADRPEAIKELKDHGIQTVIALDWSDDTYKEQVENTGMKYLRFDNSFFNTEKQESLDSFTDIIKNMKEDNFYIGCMLGSNVTSKFLNIADYFINPNGCNDLSDISTLADVENILENMTPEQKERMKLTKEDESALLKRIDKEYANWI